MSLLQSCFWRHLYSFADKRKKSVFYLPYAEVYRSERCGGFLVFPFPLDNTERTSLNDTEDQVEHLGFTKLKTLKVQEVALFV